MSDALKKCKSCGCAKIAHLTIGKKMPCLTSGCSCLAFELDETLDVNKPPMFSVRIDKTPEGYNFKVASMPHGFEMIALDSTPGVIAFVEAPDPGAACTRTWEKGQQELAAMDGPAPEPGEHIFKLLGDKKTE